MRLNAVLWRRTRVTRVPKQHLPVIAHRCEKVFVMIVPCNVFDNGRVALVRAQRLDRVVVFLVCINIPDLLVESI